MNNLSFIWAESASLATELIKPLKHLSLDIDSHGKPGFVTLWRHDKTGLRIHSEMHDVADRREVGVLNFSFVSAPLESETIVDMRSMFDHELTVFKLIIHESGTSAESGVILKSARGDEIVIVAADFPYFLAVCGVLTVPHNFVPEYPLDLYQRVPMT